MRETEVLREEFRTIFREDQKLERLQNELEARHAFLVDREELGQYLTEEEQTELSHIKEIVGPELSQKQRALAAQLQELTQVVGHEVIEEWTSEAKAAITLQANTQDAPSDVLSQGQRLLSNDFATILCCLCGVATQANEARMCLQCIQTSSDITNGVPRQAVILLCKSCQRYEAERQWLKCEWESKELLALCLKKLKHCFGDGVSHPRLTDAKFIWTESHSRRIRIVLTLQKEIVRNAVLQQNLTIDFKVAYKQCEECTKSMTPHLWISQVQVRQRAEHKRSLLYLEQLILANKAHEHCTNIVDNPNGMDFQFSKVQHGNSFINFVKSFLPVKIQSKATQQVSHDCKNNTYHNKYTTLLEVAGVCREDLVFLKKAIAQRLGGVSQIMLCERVTTGIRLRDPFNLRGVDVDNESYWKEPFAPFMTKIDLVQYVVMNIEPIQYKTLTKAGVAGRFLTGMMSNEEEKSTVKKSWGPLSRHVLVEVELCKEMDLGIPDRIVHTRSHLGNIIKIGDMVYCYDLHRSNIREGEAEFDNFLAKLPHTLVVVKKVPERKLNKRNKLKLEELPKTAGTGAAKNSAQTRAVEDDFFDDLEADAEMQRNLAGLMAKLTI